jgi:hypothetical protein
MTEPLVSSLATSLTEIHSVQDKITSSAASHLLLDVTLAVCTGWRLTEQAGQPPVWLFIVSNPSADKTTTVSTVDGAKHVKLADTFTENGLLSAYVDTTGSNTKRGGLLNDFKYGALVMKELAGFFNARQERVKKILGELNDVFDGSLIKTTGMGEPVVWRGHIGFIGCLTPAAFRQHQRTIQEIGARCIVFRIPPQTDAERKAGFEINRDREAVKKTLYAELCQRVRDHIALLHSLHLPRPSEPPAHVQGV